MARLSDFYAGDEPEINTILARVSVTSENVFLNKVATIEIMEDIFPHKFNSKKKNNISKLEDLYNYLCSVVGNSFLKEMLESLVREYQDAVNLFKAITPDWTQRFQDSILHFGNGAFKTFIYQIYGRQVSLPLFYNIDS